MKRLLVLTLAFVALVAPFAQMAPAANWYVATNGTGNGTSWAAATNSIQGAIVASSAADTVWVSNGVYDAGGVTNLPTGTALTNRVSIYKAITVRSADNNPTNTIIKGAWDPTTTNGPAAVRCVWMTNGSTLIGFTLTNGATLATGISTVQYGGGVYCQSTNTVISNCVLTGNSAVYAGGAWAATMFNCTLTGNSAVSGGGGTWAATLYNCTIVSNSTLGVGGGGNGTLFNCTLSYNSASAASPNGGGGSYFGTLTNCTLSYNSASGSGGGARGGTLFNCTLISNTANAAGGGDGNGTYDLTLSNCTLIGNSATGYNQSAGGVANSKLYNCTLIGNSAGPGNGSAGGGGAYGGNLYNCTIVSNSAPGGNAGGAAQAALYNCTIVGNRGQYYGGGVWAGALYNCTIVGNSAGGSAGGVNGSTLYNCISWGNDKVDAGGAFNYSCGVGYTNGGSVSGNITNDPLFVTNGSGYGLSHVAGDYHLRNVSPPLNAGTNFSWLNPPDVRSRDLDNQRRIDNFSRQVDMGCYELLPRGTLFIGH